MTGLWKKNDVVVARTPENAKSGGPGKPTADYFDPNDASQAIEWIRAARGRGHGSSCQCHMCMAARPIVRFAVRNSVCDCGGFCPVCWARKEVLKGRI